MFCLTNKKKELKFRCAQFEPKATKSASLSPCFHPLLEFFIILFRLNLVIECHFLPNHTKVKVLFRCDRILVSSPFTIVH